MFETKEKILNQIDASKTKSNHKSLDIIIEYLFNNDREIKLSSIEALSSFVEFPKAKLTLIELTEDRDIEYRYTALEALRDFSGDDVEKAIEKRLNDNNEIVRITAIEALGYRKAEKSIISLIKLLEDKKELVRRYAAIILGEIGDAELIPTLKFKLDKERRNTVRLGYYIALYSLGEENYLKDILKLLKNKSYRIRCATANELKIIVNTRNYKTIIENLNSALERENTIAAKSSILDTLSVILNGKYSE